MKTKIEIAAELKSEHPTIQVGSEEVGYTQLTSEEYETEIAKWVEYIYSEAEKAEKAKEAKAALFAKLGITAEEANLLLGGN